jgi:hypothetical protein
MRPRDGSDDRAEVDLDWIAEWEFLFGRAGLARRSAAIITTRSSSHVPAPPMPAEPPGPPPPHPPGFMQKSVWPHVHVPSRQKQSRSGMHSPQQHSRPKSHCAPRLHGLPSKSSASRALEHSIGGRPPEPPEPPLCVPPWARPLDPPEPPLSTPPSPPEPPVRFDRPALPPTPAFPEVPPLPPSGVSSSEQAPAAIGATTNNTPMPKNLRTMTTIADSLARRPGRALGLSAR